MNAPRTDLAHVPAPLPSASPGSRLRLGLAIVAVSVLALFSFRLAFSPPRAKAPALAERPTPPPAPVDVVTLPAGSPQLSSIRVAAAPAGSEAPVLATGRLTWDEDATVRVFVPVAGRVVRPPVGTGTRVAAGALLALLSSPDFGQAQSEASRATTDLSLATRTRDRLARLVEKGAAPRKELDSAEADLARSAAEEARASAKVRRMSAAASGKAAESAGAVDGLFPLASPLAGVVVERNVTPGQEVRPDAPLPAFTVTDPSRLWVVVDIPERELSRVKAGAPLRIRSSAWPGRTFAGALELVGDALDPATRTVRGRGRVPNPGGLLKGEMYVSVEVEEASPRRGAVVPARAVLTEGARHVVFVEEAAGRYRKVPVETGLERDGTLFLRSGLEPGTRIVTDGSLLLASLAAENAP